MQLDQAQRAFAAVLAGKQPVATFQAAFTSADLHQLTDAMIDTMLAIVAHASDADMVFVPVDPAANDPFGAPEEQHLAWTLGHVVTHTTASAEEAAALASALARGVPVEGRSRSEVAWRTITTAAQLQHRLSESRRVRHAFLGTWPDSPHLETTQLYLPRFGPLNAIGRFLIGLMHDDAHLGQMREIMRQARTARTIQEEMGERSVSQRKR
jgi:hypothetical protein